MCIRDRPYAARQALDAKGIGVEAVTVRGTLENDVAAGELVNMRLSSTACTAVSYTHLDVYKRQALYCAKRAGGGTYAFYRDEPAAS